MRMVAFAPTVTSQLCSLLVQALFCHVLGSCWTFWWAYVQEQAPMGCSEETRLVLHVPFMIWNLLHLYLLGPNGSDQCIGAGCRRAGRH